MTSVFLRVFSFLIIILFGIILRVCKVIPENSPAVLQKIMLTLTLPATIIVNFSGIHALDISAVFLIFLGFVSNILMILLGGTISRRKDQEKRALLMCCLPAFNLGTFCIPMIDQAASAEGVVAVCMFDIGNSIMCTSGTYVIVSGYLDNIRKVKPTEFLRKLFSSVPLIVYSLLFLVLFLGQSVPNFATAIAFPIANANAFIAMFFLGSSFHIEMKKRYWKDILVIIGIRHFFAVCLSFFVLFLPFQENVKKALLVMCFAPMSTISPAFTGMCGGDEGKASAAGSLSILLSLVESFAITMSI